ncbi:MAG: DUF938 domain-containing protein [Rhodanobacteraceae bacterium]
MTDKPSAPACERNRDPILSVLRAHFADRTRVLEIGSGTGQHAVYFAAAMPQLVWQASDVAGNLPGIRRRLDEANLPDAPAPIELDVGGNAWPGERYDALFTANTLHIMSWPEVEQLFAHIAGIATSDAKLAIYGPFNYDRKFTSASNAAFDASLKARAPHMGIRDRGAVDALARGIGFALVDDCEMPANNRTLVWQRQQ